MERKRESPDDFPMRGTAVSVIPDAEDCPAMTVAEVAALPAMPCERSLREAIARGDFPHRKIGRRIVVPTAELRRYLGLDA